MNLRILVLRTLESIQIWSIYERNISRAVSSISSPPLGISLCYLCSTHPSSPWGQLAWRMKWRPLGLMLGVCHLKPSADFFLLPCSLPISISLSLLLSLPYCMNPNPNPSFLCKALLSHPRLRHLYQSFASEPQPACITIKLSCLACLTLLSTLCK